jgi:hypothetical protein
MEKIAAIAAFLHEEHWNRSHGAFVMSVDLESAWKLDCERTIEESQRQHVRINIRP